MTQEHHEAFYGKFPLALKPLQGHQEPSALLIF